MRKNYNIILLLIEKNKVKHYCLVKNLSRLLSSQASNHDGKHYFCLRCLNPFWINTKNTVMIMKVLNRTTGKRNDAKV